MPGGTRLNGRFFLHRHWNWTQIVLLYGSRIHSNCLKISQPTNTYWRSAYGANLFKENCCYPTKALKVNAARALHTDTAEEKFAHYFNTTFQSQMDLYEPWVLRMWRFTTGRQELCEHTQIGATHANIKENFNIVFCLNFYQHDLHQA